MNRYVVVAGDTHYEIAQRHGLTLDQLYEMNPGLSNNVYGMQIGSVVNVPLYTNGQRPPTTCPPSHPPPTVCPPPVRPPHNHHHGHHDGHDSDSNSSSDSDDEKKKKAGMIAGGLVGTAALAGIGALALNGWKKQQAFNSQSNAPCFSQYQSSQGLLQWRPVCPGQQIPQDSIALGRDSDGTNLYAARAAIHGGWHIGKTNGRGDVYISYGGKELRIKGDYQIFCGPPRGVTVLPQCGQLNLQGLSMQPIDAGHEADGDRLYVAITDHLGSIQVGKCSARNSSGCNFPYGGKEVADRTYRVVVIA
ncbi:hypothetical protein HDU98_006687 [Podochytrium sp. JEL0797]|nr:hypothetical protein HDU98_006687 [Podochytrium sp. JEL0797]